MLGTCVWVAGGRSSCPRLSLGVCPGQKDLPKGVYIGTRVLEGNLATCIPNLKRPQPLVSAVGLLGIFPGHMTLNPEAAAASSLVAVAGKKSRITCRFVRQAAARDAGPGTGARGSWAGLQVLFPQLRPRPRGEPGQLGRPQSSPLYSGPREPVYLFEGTSPYLYTFLRLIRLRGGRPGHPAATERETLGAGPAGFRLCDVRPSPNVSGIHCAPRPAGIKAPFFRGH